MRQLRWLIERMDLRSLAFDLVIILFTEFVLYGALTGGEYLLEAAGPAYAVALMVLVQVFVPAYSGLVWKGYEGGAWDLYHSGWSALIKTLFIYGMVLVYIFGLLVGAHHNGYLGGAGILLISLLGGGLLTLAGGSLAARFNDTDLGFFGFFRRVDERTITAGALGIACAVLLPQWLHGPLAAALGSTGAVIALVLLVPLEILGMVWIGRWVAHQATALGSRSPCAHAVGRVTYALFIAILMCFWLEVAQVILAETAMGLGGGFFFLTVSGLLPVRVLVEFEPPRTPVTMVTGILSMAWLVVGFLRGAA